jgi:hypothetical protein
VHEPSHEGTTWPWEKEAWTFIIPKARRFTYHLPALSRLSYTCEGAIYASPALAFIFWLFYILSDSSLKCVKSSLSMSVRLVFRSVTPVVSILSVWLICRNLSRHRVVHCYFGKSRRTRGWSADHYRGVVHHRTWPQCKTFIACPHCLGVLINLM